MFFVNLTTYALGMYGLKEQADEILIKPQFLTFLSKYIGDCLITLGLQYGKVVQVLVFPDGRSPGTARPGPVLS